MVGTPPAGSAHRSFRIPAVHGNCVVPSKRRPLYWSRKMRRVIAGFFIALLAVPGCLGAAGNSWNKLRYRGGTVQAKVNPFDWNTVLTVSQDAIVLAFGPKQTLRLRPAQVAALSYGQEAHRRVADMVALSIVATPIALFGILHQS